MARILVTGSAQGIGAECARQLIARGHEVVVHGRDAARGAVALAEAPGAAGVVIGGLDSLNGVRTLAADAGDRGPFDVIVHNAGIGPHRDEPTYTEDGWELSAQVNLVAPYLLTALLPLPQRLVFVGSDASDQGTLHLDDLGWREREWDRWGAYNDSKLYVAMLAVEIARRYPAVVSTVVHPGWVKTVMGGVGAKLELAEGADSLVWLAVSDEPDAVASGRFIDRRRERALNPVAHDAAARTALMGELERFTGAALP